MMSIVNSCLVIAGLLTMDGEALPSQQVILIQENPYQVIAGTTTDEAGNFSFSVQADAETMHILAKVRKDGNATLMHHKLSAQDLSNSIAMDCRTSDLIPVHCKLILPKHAPRSLDIFVDLMKVDGIPDGLQPYFQYVSPSVADSYFYKFTSQERKFTWRVMPGRIRIGAAYFMDEVLAFDDKPQSFAVTSVIKIPAQEAIEGKWMLGFELDVQSETTLELHVQAVQY